MKRSPLQRKAPLKSGGSWKRSPLAPADRFTAMKRSEMKRRIKKPTVAEGSKYLEACRGEDCYIAVMNVCTNNRETVVPCHSNQSIHGKGMGIKARHEFTVPGCAACHAWLDQGKAERSTKVNYWNLAYEEWEPVRARKMGIELQEAA